MNEHTLNELCDALSALRDDIAIALPWDALHRWFDTAPLELPHYEQINRQWALVWRQTSDGYPVPAVHLYPGADKLTLVRETTHDDPPAIALHDLASVVAELGG